MVRAVLRAAVTGEESEDARVGGILVAEAFDHLRVLAELNGARRR